MLRERMAGGPTEKQHLRLQQSAPNLPPRSCGHKDGADVLEVPQLRKDPLDFNLKLSGCVWFETPWSR